MQKTHNIFHHTKQRNDWVQNQAVYLEEASERTHFLKIFIAQKIQRDTQDYRIVPLTNLP
jgi:hypothetical protein